MSVCDHFHRGIAVEYELPSYLVHFQCASQVLHTFGIDVFSPKRQSGECLKWVGLESFITRMDVGKRDVSESSSE